MKKTTRRRRKPKNERPRLRKELDVASKRAAKDRDGWRCQHCGIAVAGHGAHGSHVIPCGQSALLRWDLLNLLCLCFKCHRYWWHLNPLEATAWFERTYPERYAYLMQRKSEVKQWTTDEMRELLRTLEAQ